MALDWDKLVEERNAWVSYNFPNHTGGKPSLGSVLGVIEELGELTHHHLKQDQQIRGDDTYHESEAKDAIGDLTVYLMGVMHHWKVRPKNTTDGAFSRDSHSCILRLTQDIGLLAGYERTGSPTYRETLLRIYMVSSIVVHMKGYCNSRGWDYEQIVLDTWNSVKKRDWIKYPDTGLPPKAENLTT